MSDAERAAFADLPFDEAEWLAELGLDAGFGEERTPAGEVELVQPVPDR